MHRVLVVDDRQSIQTTVRVILCRAGYDVRTAGSVAEARDLLQTTEADVVISDQRMPGESGLDLLQWVQREKPSVRTVLMTAILAPSLRAEAQRFGARGFVEKPFCIQALTSVIAAALG